MACPFFVPTRKSESAAWLHPARLPLGAGWDGVCSAPGSEGVVPDDEQLHHGCNLGYASNCTRLPERREWDAVRFAVAREHKSGVCVTYVCERNHLPGDHGALEYSTVTREWISTHSNPGIQKLAECFLESWLAKTTGPAPDECLGEVVQENQS